MKKTGVPGKKSSPFMCGGSVCGEYHGSRDEPCQDASGWTVVPGRRGFPPYGVIAVADGLGSARLSGIGAATAVTVALESARSALPVPVGSIGGVLFDIARSARETVLTRSREYGCSPRDLASTFICVLFSRHGIAAVHIGDGCVVARDRHGGLFMLTSPGGEYANEVVPLTAPEWKSELVTAYIRQRNGSVVVMTDGCVRAACTGPSDRLVPRPAFFDPLFSYVLSQQDEKSASGEIRSFLRGQGMTRCSDDDKTIVVGVIHTAHGADEITSGVSSRRDNPE